MSVYPKDLASEDNSIIRNLPEQFFSIIFSLRVYKSRWLNLVDFLDKYEILDTSGAGKILVTAAACILPESSSSFFPFY